MGTERAAGFVSLRTGLARLPPTLVFAELGLGTASTDDARSSLLDLELVRSTREKREKGNT